MFKTVSEVFNWCETFINHERNLNAATFRLDRMIYLSQLAGDPWKKCRVIHIAGSKGKGSISAMLASIFTEKGDSTARFASPHVLDPRERMTLSNEFFKDEIYIQGGNELKTIVQRAVMPGKAPPTYFELMCLLFFILVKTVQADTLILETGLGGRLDATNIIPKPDLCILMPIELEHSQLLGKDIASIAEEKAGIIKSGVPILLHSNITQDAYSVFLNRAEQKKARVYKTDDFFKLKSCSYRQGLNTINLINTISHEDFIIKSPLIGNIQGLNAATAAAASIILLSNKDETYRAINQGLLKTSLPARFQIISKFAFPIVVDGAHTKNSVKLTLETWLEIYGGGGTLLFSCAEDKDVMAMAEYLAPHFNDIIITKTGGQKQSNLCKIEEAFAPISNKLHRIDNTDLAIQKSLVITESAHSKLLVCGSFYLAASFLSSLSLSNFE